MRNDCPGCEARESCGLFGAYGVPEACLSIYRGLFSLQHRGQEGAGIVTGDGQRVKSVRGVGLVSDVFSARSWKELKGHLGIGHVRYSTTGSTLIQNVQPIVVECVDGVWAVAHNGNLVNAGELRAMYQESGAIFQTSTDSEVLVHLLADPMFRRRPHRVGRALSELKGSFAFLLMTRNCVMAARDPFGIRPLALGALGQGHVVASETCALRQVGAAYVRDVEPGELLVMDETGLHGSQFAEPAPRAAHCVFELVYFARPDSLVFGENVHKVRLRYGMRLAEEHPVQADIVISVPDSGNSAALGFSRKSGIPLDFGFIRNHYVGRTFIMPLTGQREQGVDMKLSVLHEVVKGQRVVVVDDSIVRGTTSRRRIRFLRQAGAAEVHVRISCPPTAHPCFYGIDFATREELAAGARTVEEIRKFIEADSLGYLSVEGLLSPLQRPNDFCAACFTGKYPLDPSRAQGKKDWETNRPDGELGLNL
ncbi:MAG: amidophosphoribosyltransferase [Verrucomicrobiota bacterium]|nr:amidophosphoribosyltransferase [Verrucomicrobiota bacterium]